MPERNGRGGLRQGVRALLLAVCLLLFAAAACAEVRVVWNGDPWDQRLNLRAKPDKASASLGRYYTGTRVQVLEDMGEWCRVRIAMGTRGAQAEGCMMSAYLRPLDGWSGAGMLPYMTLAGEAALADAQGAPLEGGQLAAGEAVYVMGVDGTRVHVLTEGGWTGYLPARALEGELRCPEDADRILLETTCTAQGGAVLRETPDGDAPAVATLYGGVCLRDSWLTAQRETVFAALGDEADAARGYLVPGEWTRFDNGANCGCMYPVYQQNGQIVEVLGHMADGRRIVRRGGVVTLEEASMLAGAVPLDGRPGDTTFFYAIALSGDVLDNEAVSCATEGLLACGAADEATGEPLTREALGGMNARVTRAVQPQWEMRMLFVEFTDETGVRRAFAELDPDTGEFILAGGNG